MSDHDIVSRFDPSGILNTNKEKVDIIVRVLRIINIIDDEIIIIREDMFNVFSENIFVRNISLFPPEIRISSMRDILYRYRRD